MRRLLSVGILSFCLFNLSGCLLEGQKYQVAMRPEKEKIHRKITFPADASRAEQIGKIYQPRFLPVPKWGKITLSRTFISSVPKDIGQFGTYTFFGSSMGDSYAYSERICGSDDMIQKMTQLHQAQDKLVDFLIGWFQLELGKEPGFVKLRKFCDENLRQDIKNLTTHYCLPGFNAKDEHNPEMIARAAQYLVERGYFKTEELPALYRAGAGLETDEKGEQLFLIVRKLIARKMGYPENKEIPACLDFLANADRAQASLNKYAVTTEEYKKQLKEWKGKKDSNEKKTDPLDIAGGLFSDSLGIDIHLFADTLDITLACPTQPYATNGKWNKKTLAVSWSVSLAEDKYGLPEFCYAVWSVPNEKFQKDHFGRVIFQNETLAEYCLWQNGLTEKQAREWENFLSILRPGKDLMKNLSAFYFSGEPKPPSTRPAYSANTWITRIKEAISPPTTQSSQPEK